ncbi:MAG TPA: zinc metallopeptidase [Candidatus Limivivens merdigallinarum]|uniref:Zinc metallopeptidase n=1 Tax=Candidatus Limivivens merdigallinarum TaxID=2840859 RepID=A0A9D0ZXT4_9FIRM|nr:zinc metallopeptidase [Candidatus Limivivens merdigallinarum]
MLLVHYGFGYWFDPTYMLVLIGLLLSLGASALVKSTFAKYSKVRSMSGLTGAEAARRVLNASGIYDVRIERVAGNLTDHYDPRSKVLRLSSSTYGSNSVAAVCVAAHECGHAVQDAKHYGPLVLRSTLVPAANLGSTAAWPIFILGLIFSMRPLLTLGILLFGLAVLFQLVTLPVEINASTRAVRILENTGILTSGELTGGKAVLRAAALTYVASLAASILQLLRLIILAGGRDRD